MSNGTAASLRLDLQPSGTAVRLKASSAFHEELGKLAARFASARHEDAGIIELDLDDLLSNIRELAQWPPHGTVEWDQQLVRVVQDVHNDSATVARRLDGAPHDTESMTEAQLLSLLGPPWTAPLTTFQVRDISKLLSLEHGANFSVPGSGKTRAALALFQARRSQGDVARLLVVSPKSAYESWLFENRECLAEPLHAQVLAGRLDPLAELVLVNYERLDPNQAALSNWLAAEPSMVVLDEAHRMKRGTEGVYGSACLALGPRAKRRVILTGTPAPNGVRDLQSLFAFVWPGHGRRSVADAVDGGNLRHASSRLKPLFARTNKAELGLPPVTTRIRRLALPPLHHEIYSALTGEMTARAARSRGDLEALGRVTMYLLMAASSPALLAVGTTKYEPLLYRVPPIDVPESAPLLRLLEDLPSYEMSPKYQETVAIVHANASAGRKTLVWSTFVRSLMTLQKMLLPYEPAIVHGGSQDRDEQLQRFREDPACMVLLSNPATLGEGISLHQHCHDAVYVERDFAAGRFLQSVDRIHRLGLAPDVSTNVTVLMSEGTIDELVEQRLAAKLEFMEAVLDDPAVGQLADLEEEPTLSASMDIHDVAALLEHLHVAPAE